MDNKTFHYSYSPTEKQEIEEIKKKYEPSKEESMAQRIKQMDNNVENSATIASIAFGLFFALVFGAGLSLCLAYEMYVYGAAIGLIGMAGMSTTPFFCSRYKEKKKNKTAKKIIELCNEYLNNNAQ
ncbi:MAG: hypothetical protein IJW86_09800 [Clostridia bacterium]|nr:hypothetical protein [Clostridia bacterium]